MNRILRYGILIADVIWIGAAFVFAQLLSNLHSGPSMRAAVSAVTNVQIPAVAVALAMWTVLFFSKRLEGFRGGWHLPSVFSQVIVGAFYLTAALLVLALLAGHSYSWTESLYLAGLLPVGFMSIRCSAWRLVTLRVDPQSKRRVVILGVGRTARELAHKIASHPEMSMEVAGLLFPSDADPAPQPPNAPSSISLRSLSILRLLQERRVRDLIIVEPVPPGREMEKLVSSCRGAGIRIHLVPQHYELYLSKAELKEIDDVPLLSLEERKLPPAGVRVKRCIDVIGALLLLALSAPLLALCVAALYMSKGAALRRELRCGENGVPFWMYRLNIERAERLSHGYARFLLQFSLTELPQLWNVLRGEMSLVGPRPESRDKVKHYSLWQRRRLTVLPGLTGLAQVRGLREEHSSEEKTRFDLQYIGQWSLFLDLSLLLQTAWALAARRLKKDRFRIVPALNSELAAGFFARRMMHADSAQSGAD